MENFDIGIDLGTTKSGIAKYENGAVKILKNPVGFQDILPSVVAYKNSRIIVGDKALEQLRTNPKQVFTSFKRQMGTEESWIIEDTENEVTPVRLSTLVLKELLGFGMTDKITAAIITIPASFDTIQSNATKQAGYDAGLTEVALLQEPIAACLAYANDNNLDIKSEKKWLVYDFGGGTFDAAIVKINDRELKVIDHRGDNYLGGMDLDHTIMERILIPQIQLNTGQKNLWDKINEKDNEEYTKFGKYLLYLAEELKKELSLKTDSWVEVNYERLELFVEFSVSRSEFDALVEPLFIRSVELVKDLLNENDLESGDIERIVMVGGSTFIPYIRLQLEKELSITVDTSIDPTTAVIKGAAYYAGNKPRKLESIEQSSEVPSKDSPKFDFTVVFEQQTQDTEEIIAFKCGSTFKGSYRISRLDGGFDTGLVEFENSAQVFVNLLPKQINSFALTIYDKREREVFTDQSIKINHGFYNVHGQPLPNDICIELDSEHETYLEVIFKKNELLPLKKSIYKTFSKSIPKGSNDKILINIVEGKVGTMPGANLNIGYVEINGKLLKDDLIRGTDIELSFSISESRDLAVEIYIPSLDQEFNHTFNPQFQANLDIGKTIQEIDRGLNEVNEQMTYKERTEDFMALAELVSIKRGLEEVKNEVLNSNKRQFNNKSYQLNDQKRKLLYRIDSQNRMTEIADTIEEYKNYRTYLQNKEDQMTPSIKNEFNKITREEKSFLTSGDKYLIKRKLKALEDLHNDLWYENDESYYTIFIALKMEPESSFRKYSKVEKLLVEGEKAFEKNEAKKLKSICQLIFSYLIPSKRDSDQFSGTGLK